MKYLAGAYLFFALMSIGHWFATEYSHLEDNAYARNPVISIFIAALWPSYVSYQIFK